jgi:hypothetical protein
MSNGALFERLDDSFEDILRKSMPEPYGRETTRHAP